MPDTHGSVEAIITNSLKNFVKEYYKRKEENDPFFSFIKSEEKYKPLKEEELLKELARDHSSALKEYLLKDDLLKDVIIRNSQPYIELETLGGNFLKDASRILEKHLEMIESNDLNRLFGTHKELTNDDINSLKDILGKTKEAFEAELKPGAYWSDIVNKYSLARENNSIIPKYIKIKIIKKLNLLNELELDNVVPILNRLESNVVNKTTLTTFRDVNDFIIYRLENEFTISADERKEIDAVKQYRELRDSYEKKIKTIKEEYAIKSILKLYAETSAGRDRILSIITHQALKVSASDQSAFKIFEELKATFYKLKNNEDSFIMKVANKHFMDLPSVKEVFKAFKKLDQEKVLNQITEDNFNERPWGEAFTHILKFITNFFKKEQNQEISKKGAREIFGRFTQSVIEEKERRINSINNTTFINHL